jgi:hypothetical protein
VEAPAERRREAARPAETRVLPTPVLAPKTAKVGEERGKAKENEEEEEEE